MNTHFIFLGALSRWLRRTALIGLVVLAAGCASVKQYKGPDLPKDQVATITKDSMRLHIKGINGRPLSGLASEIQLLPGRNELSIAYQIANLASVVNQTLVFEARAGREYMLDYWRDDMRWGALLIDKASGQTVARGIPESVDMEPAEKDRARKQFVPPAGAAGLYVFRHEHMGNTYRMTVSVNGQPIGQTMQKIYLYKELPPGRHHIESLAEDTASIEVDVQAGQVYYVWQEVKMGASAPRSKLHLVDASKGQKGVMESRLAVTR